ncbi:hypothetical protein HK100_001879 [Physocladia obscura]|uniref:Uncharacterized protein n=1 Tax=Physocladia obscura TaxID=109957 RepID=A0AAD5XLI1_9FUNG|nr:hypothetical protein HK100_001879 [Physocladia obscura]
MLLEQNKYVRGLALGLVALAAVVIVARVAAVVVMPAKAKPSKKSKHNKKRASSKLHISSNTSIVTRTTTAITTANTANTATTVSPLASASTSAAASLADAQPGTPLLVRYNSSSFRFPASIENKSPNASKKNIATAAQAGASAIFSVKSFHTTNSDGQKEIPYEKLAETVVQVAISTPSSSVRIGSILMTDPIKSASFVVSPANTVTDCVKEPLRSPSRKNSEASSSQPRYGLDFHDVGTLATIVAINGSAIFSNLSETKVSEVTEEENVRGRLKCAVSFNSMKEKSPQISALACLPLSAITEISITSASRSVSPSKKFSILSKIPVPQTISILPQSVDREKAPEPAVTSHSPVRTSVLPTLPEPVANRQEKTVKVIARAKSPESTKKVLSSIATVTETKILESSGQPKVRQSPSEQTSKVKKAEYAIMKSKSLDTVLSSTVPKSSEPSALRSNTPETTRSPQIAATPLVKKVQGLQQVITPEASLNSAYQSPSTSPAQVYSGSKYPVDGEKSTEQTSTVAAYRSKSPQLSIPGSVSNTSIACALSPSSVNRLNSPTEITASFVAPKRNSEDFVASTIPVVKKKSSELHVNAKEFVPTVSLDSDAPAVSTTLRVTAQEFVPFNFSTTEESSPTSSSTSLRATAIEFTPGEYGDDETYTNDEEYMSPPFLGGDPTEAYNPYASTSSTGSTIDGYYGDYGNNMIDPNVAIWDPISGTYVYVDGYGYDSEYIPPNSGIQITGSSEYVNNNGGVSNSSRRGSTRGGKGFRSGNGQKRQGNGTGNGNRKKSGSGYGSNGSGAPSGPTLADFIKVDKKKGVVVAVADTVKAPKIQANLVKCDRVGCENSLYDLGFIFMRLPKDCIGKNRKKMSYFVETRPTSPDARAIEKKGKRQHQTKHGLGTGHNESEDIWNYGYKALFTSTNAADFIVQKPDPRAKPQRPIKNGLLGAGTDHISFLDFEDAEIIFRRRLGLSVKDVVNEKDVEKVRLTSTQRQDYTVDGFVVDDTVFLKKTAGRPTKPNDECEPFATLQKNVVMAVAHAEIDKATRLEE